MLEALMSFEGQGRDQGVNIMTNMKSLDFVHDVLISLPDQYQESRLPDLPPPSSLPFLQTYQMKH